MALDWQALCALRVERVSEALAAVRETLERMQEGALYNLQRGSALSLRAACWTALKDWSAAERDLDASWNLLQPHAAMTIAAGVHGMLARWWAITARLRTAQGDPKSAVKAWQEAVARSRYLTALPQASGPFLQSALARTLHGLGHALTAESSPELAEAAFGKSRSLRQAVGLPPFTPDEPSL